MVLGYVIFHRQLKEFLAIDEQSAGCPYWSSVVKSANLFKSVQLAKEYLKCGDFTYYSHMNNGSLSRPHMLERGKNDIEILPIELGNAVDSLKFNVL